MRLWILLAALTLAGCGTLTPKKVELFQDTVQVFPEQSARLRELEREAIYRAVDKTSEVVQAAVSEGASTNITAPAKDAEVLTKAVAVSLGPPESPAPASMSAPKLAVKLESAVAEHNTKIEKFKVQNNENEGKKIEGTGWFQVSYVWWVGGILVTVFVLFSVGKILLTVASLANPGAAIGLGAVNVAQSVVTKGFSQLVKGGEDFKGWVSQEVADAGLKQKILDAFRAKHERAQDSDVQSTVRTITS
jgi:hypothetical protein